VGRVKKGGYPLAVRGSVKGGNYLTNQLKKSKCHEDSRKEGRHPHRKQSGPQLGGQLKKKNRERKGGDRGLRLLHSKKINRQGKVESVGIIAEN